MGSAAGAAHARRRRTQRLAPRSRGLPSRAGWYAPARTPRRGRAASCRPRRGPPARPTGFKLLQPARGRSGRFAATGAARTRDPSGPAQGPVHVHVCRRRVLRRDCSPGLLLVPLPSAKRWRRTSGIVSQRDFGFRAAVVPRHLQGHHHDEKSLSQFRPRPAQRRRLSLKRSENIGSCLPSSLTVTICAA